MPHFPVTPSPAGHHPGSSPVSFSGLRKRMENQFSGNIEKILRCDQNSKKYFGVGKRSCKYKSQILKDVKISLSFKMYFCFLWILLDLCVELNTFPHGGTKVFDIWSLSGTLEYSRFPEIKHRGKAKNPHRNSQNIILVTKEECLLWKLFYFCLLFQFLIATETLSF